MAFFGRIAYRDPAWNVWLNYLDVQDNFNDEVGFVQRRGVKTTKATSARRRGRASGAIRMLEPMVVISYITDQQNRMVGRTQHFMNGFYMQDGSFINVIYQRDLDVLDVPFVVPQTKVSIPVGTYKFDEATFTYNTNPAKRFYERFSWNPMQFYDGHQAGGDCAQSGAGDQEPVERAELSAGTTSRCRGAISSRTWRSCASTTRCRRARRSGA
jgi:hypothetical protein